MFADTVTEIIKEVKEKGPNRAKRLWTEKERSRVLNELKERTGSPGKLMEILSTCIRCHNCMYVCPICYCKKCLFESSVFEHRADKFLVTLVLRL